MRRDTKTFFQEAPKSFTTTPKAMVICSIGVADGGIQRYLRVVSVGKHSAFPSSESQGFQGKMRAAATDNFKTSMSIQEIAR